MTRGRTRVFLVDDQPEVVDELRRALDREFHIVGAVDSGEAMLAEAPKLSPHVIVLDVSLPGMSGIEAAARLKTVLPETKIVMLSMHANPLYVSEALRAGASAYVLKTSGISELTRAIREVRVGNEYRSPLLPKG